MKYVKFIEKKCPYEDVPDGWQPGELFIILNNRPDHHITQRLTLEEYEFHKNVLDCGNRQGVYRNYLGEITWGYVFQSCKWTNVAGPVFLLKNFDMEIIEDEPDFYFTTYLTEDEHYMAEWAIRDECATQNIEVVYYRRFKNGHHPCYRECKIAVEPWKGREILKKLNLPFENYHKFE